MATTSRHFCATWSHSDPFGVIFDIWVIFEPKYVVFVPLILFGVYCWCHLHLLKAGIMVWRVVRWPEGQGRAHSEDLLERQLPRHLVAR